jgi:hypothetical protein
LSEILRERIMGEDRRDQPRRASRPHLTDDQAARLFDAAIAVLAATRSLVGVGEDILRERRDRLTEGRDGPDDEAADDRPRRTRIDLTY